MITRKHSLWESGDWCGRKQKGEVIMENYEKVTKLHATSTMPEICALSEVENYVKEIWAVCKDTDLGTLLTGAQLSHSFITRKLNRKDG